MLVRGSVHSTSVLHLCVCVCVCVCISEGGFQSGGGTNRELGDFGKITKKGVRMSEG